MYALCCNLFPLLLFIDSQLKFKTVFVIIENDSVDEQAELEMHIPVMSDAYRSMRTIVITS